MPRGLGLGGYPWYSTHGVALPSERKAGRSHRGGGRGVLHRRRAHPACGEVAKVSPTGTAWPLPVIRCTPGTSRHPIGTGHASGGSNALCYRRNGGPGAVGADGGPLASATALRSDSWRSGVIWIGRVATRARGLFRLLFVYSPRLLSPALQASPHFASCAAIWGLLAATVAPQKYNELN